MREPRLRLVLVLAVLVLALALKVDRYGRDHSVSHAAGAGRVEAVMAAHGWRPQDRARLDGDVYEQFQFRHEGCPAPVVVALLGGNAEGFEFFRRQHGGDAMFVQNGAVVEQPSAFWRQFEIVLERGRAWLGRSASPVLPVLAIAPAAAEAVSDCRGPSRLSWRETPGTGRNASLKSHR